MSATAWKSRIVGYGEESPDELVANPSNWRSHPSHQQRFLGGVLDQVGWVSEVMVNKRSGLIVDGHLRVALAISRGEPTVPVRYVDLDENEEALVLASLDPLGSMATTDAARLDELLIDVSAGNEAVEALLEMLSSKTEEELPPASTRQSDEPTEWGVVVICANQQEQDSMLLKLRDQGLIVRELAA